MIPFINLDKNSNLFVTNGNVKADLPSSDDTTNNDVLPETRYDDIQKTLLPRGADKYEAEDSKIIKVEPEKLPHSLFSDYHAIKVVQMDGANYPRNDYESFNQSQLYKNVTMLDLINYNKGAVLFKKEDFIYTRLYGKIPNNRMIVLRRFVNPVFDDITTIHQTEPDIARAVTFLDGDRNNIKQLLTFTTKMKWRELNSEIQQMEMSGGGHQSGMNWGDSKAAGYMKNVLTYTDPTFGQQAAMGSQRLNYNPYHDQNKTYGEIDSIDSVFIRDRGIDYTHDIDIVVQFEAKSYDGINSRVATLDWISNMMLLGSIDATFWGGARYWRGVRPTKFLNDLKFLAPNNFNDFLTKSNVSFKGFVNSFSGEGGKDNALKVLKQVAGNALNIGLGKMLDSIGRPSIPVMNSLLNGTPMGQWHLTIGNPLNPVVSIGNLYCDGVEISPAEDAEWSYDDFPNRWEATFKLRHQQPRDRAAIERMFNCGQQRTYNRLEDVMNKLKSNKKKSSHTNPQDIFSLVSTYANKFGNFKEDAIDRNIKSNDLFKYFDK